MSENLTRLKEAVAAWHEHAKNELEAEAAFLEKVKQSGDDVDIARYAVGTTYSDLIADTISELAS